MTISVRELNPRTLSVIETSFERTPDPHIWVREVEEFLLGSAARDLVRQRIRNLWLIEHNGTPVGLTANHQHDEWAAELLQAVMIDHRFRGQGLSRPVLETLLERGTGLRSRIVRAVAAPPLKTSGPVSR